MKTDEQWEAILTPNNYLITRHKATEPAFTGKYYDFYEKGFYLCVCCKLILFSSDSKFDSGSGWPSFSKSFNKLNIKELKDNSHGRCRTEVLCNRCDAHLGHVFNDGPLEKPLRFCINSGSLDFKTKEALEKSKATFAGGCFWGVEEDFRRAYAVISSKTGYTGGTVDNPDYKSVCLGTTEHAEAVELLFDETVTSYKELLKLFFEIHDPTTLNRQGPDIGTQYRSAIFYHNTQQHQQALEYIREFQKNYMGYIVTELLPAKTFYDAEDYHQQYIAKQ